MIFSFLLAENKPKIKKKKIYDFWNATGKISKIIYQVMSDINMN